ncbi:hypothetical protein B0A48_04495 [Cryoendolithus antarcticus]|uniref:Uncharacterized protein n=1 Tax=Cryoendolithus antarcticus TaxID=1507870 RepID=A0A1V8TFV5_9PEZI|nr:hypothetical protein B0A48_04495 [Cryoendolithus antarcticus]OQO26074.1 hypothetical protein B0A51_07006 [Rachicladosporium sp. CCFEE 5018]
MSSSGLAVPDAAFVAIIIAASGCFVLVGWAIHSNFHRQQPEGMLHAQAGLGVQSQDEYMREVRGRNYEAIRGVFGGRYERRGVASELS